ncbi:aromatic ring-hydroxylating dioxygenase subunit alpha [Mycobacterium sp. 050128]|uniref:aromatic ring-hydroxylating oxygenase subunit alpha n=1 Tax=Mycobacterium TaxID=1763 RepID=UPI0005B46906|nr:aromatic ring-hydroxylating dioxygenase subunit alpha [Mycobacterium intracellulare]ARV80161.1 aromatic ring-hydroxylating dioxygenase subunit alpha [Mycobacterium intracellulare subsp. chimaera]ASL18792.1 ring hydroxylating dioxygenase subunit alpha [Mycobacterium intracellulare subsp. chimaera]KPN47661.1 ribosomal subunit interface protein [Mycobacterium intracellulare subsp. chimaera]KPN48971.1 ribosomal subunit interface protein [Mycobacterium intracellulare subsp. chimaera]MDM3909161.1
MSLDSSGGFGPTARSLVDVDRGEISREIFINDVIFKRELEYLFPRAWLFVGHASQVATPGQFFSSRMGSDPVLVTRDAQGGINVLLNSCRHRGMAVCRYDEGRTLQFTCPYHGWSYSMDGSLVSTPGDLHGVPQHGMAYGNTLDKSKWGLVRTAKSHNYKGLIFACWDPDAPEFDQYVGDFHHWLDNLADAFDGTEGTTEVFRGVQKWRIRSNWKFVSENFLGDTYHGATTHVSVEQVGIGPGGRNSRRHGERHDQGGFSQGRVKTSFRMGHGASDNLAYEMPYPEFADEPDMNAYFVKAWEVRKKRLRNQGRRLGGRGPATMFPNMSFSAGFPRTILVSHPISATETEVWRWYLIDKSAPEHVRDWLRHYYIRYSGPGGMTEQDDMENWDYATGASLGVIARRYPYNYQQGLGRETLSELDRAVHSDEPIAGEVNARAFYRRWAEFVDNLSWPELVKLAEKDERAVRS